MAEYLLMPLIAPMQSWGDVTVGGTDRQTLPFPTYSGLSGMICAALGIDRHDREQLANVHDNLHIIIAELFSGILQYDFYTVQNIVRADGKPGGSVVGRKYYLAEAVFLAAVSLKSDCNFTLEKIGAALLFPHYDLYAGRRAYPFSAQPVFHTKGIPRIFEWNNPFSEIEDFLRNIEQYTMLKRYIRSEIKFPVTFYCDSQDMKDYSLNCPDSYLPYNIRDKYHGISYSWGYREFETRDVFSVQLLY